MAQEVVQGRRSEAEQHSGEFERRRRQQRREPSPLRGLWQEHRFELLWGTALVLGLFLLFGPLARMVNIGRSDNTVALLSRILAAIAAEVDRLADLVLEFMQRTNWSVKIGLLLLVSALIALPFRVRWWLMHRSPWLVLSCPRCKGSLHRTHRRALERTLSTLVPMRRYRCLKCNWSGIRIEGEPDGAAFTAAGRSSKHSPNNQA